MSVYHIFMTSPLWLVVGPLDYTAVSVSGKVEIPLSGLTTPLLFLQMTALSRSVIVV